MLSLYHSLHCSATVNESLKAGRGNWSLQTRILFTDPEFIKFLEKELKFRITGDLNDFYKRYNYYYITPDWRLYINRTRALELAVRTSDRKFIAEVSSHNREDNYLIFNYAVRNNQIDLINDMISLPGVNINFAMKEAAKHGHLEMIEIMLAFGANDYIYTMYNAADYGHLHIVEKMLSLNADNYNDVMCIAARWGHLSIVEKMLSLGADNYQSAINNAQMHEHTEIINLLQPYL